MNKKGIGWYSIFLISVIAMLISFSFLVLSKYIPSIQKELKRQACMEKVADFCKKWIESKKEPDWDQMKPTNCEDVGVKKPETLEDCLNFLK